MTHVLERETPRGLGRVHVHPVAAPVGLLVLGHGAGGSVTAPDLVAVAHAALALDVAVALVEQPYRVAGRRSPAPAQHLDDAWTALVAQVRLPGLPLVVGGRSSGARVACRTSAATGAAAVLCLAFPLRPPPRKAGGEAKDRTPELDAVGVPVLVVQGAGDPFGVPEPAPGREVAVVPGTHALRTGVDAVATAVAGWLPGVLV